MNLDMTPEENCPLPESIAGKDIRYYYEEFCLATVRLGKLRRLVADVCTADTTTASDELRDAITELAYEMRRQELWLDRYVDGFDALR